MGKKHRLKHARIACEKNDAMMARSRDNYHANQSFAKNNGMTLIQSELDKRSDEKFTVVAETIVAVPRFDQYGNAILDENGKQKTKNVQRGAKIVARTKYTTSSKMNRTELDVRYNKLTGEPEMYVKNQYEPTFGVNVEPFHGRARIEKIGNELGVDVKPFKQQTYSNRTKYTHLNPHMRVRGDVGVSGGMVTNEFTTPTHTIEID